MSSECLHNRCSKIHRENNCFLNLRTMQFRHLLKFSLMTKRRRDSVTLWINWETCLTSHLSTSSEGASSGIRTNDSHPTKACSTNGSSRDYRRTSYCTTLTTTHTPGRTTTHQILRVRASKLHPCNKMLAKKAHSKFKLRDSSLPTGDQEKQRLARTTTRAYQMQPSWTVRVIEDRLSRRQPQVLASALLITTNSRLVREVRQSQMELFSRLKTWNWLRDKVHEKTQLQHLVILTPKGNPYLREGNKQEAAS